MRQPRHAFTHKSVYQGVLAMEYLNTTLLDYYVDVRLSSSLIVAYTAIKPTIADRHLPLWCRA
jgi:hypothetical protein